MAQTYSYLKGVRLVTMHNKCDSCGHVFHFHLGSQQRRSYISEQERGYERASLLGLPGAQSLDHQLCDTFTKSDAWTFGML